MEHSKRNPNKKTKHRKKSDAVWVSARLSQRFSERVNKRASEWLSKRESERERERVNGERASERGSERAHPVTLGQYRLITVLYKHHSNTFPGNRTNCSR